MLSNRAVCTFKECSDSSPFISAVWPPCAWPTRSWRLTGKWRRRKSKAWEERRRSRRKGWAWALATEGSSIRAALHTICQKPSCLWEYVTDKKTKKNILFSFVLSSAVSHSVMSDMQVIEQETPVGAKSSPRSKLDMFDEPGFTSGPPKYAWKTWVDVQTKKVFRN